MKLQKIQSCTDNIHQSLSVSPVDSHGQPNFPKVNGIKKALSEVENKIDKYIKENPEFPVEIRVQVQYESNATTRPSGFFYRATFN